MNKIALTEIDIVRKKGLTFDHWSEKKIPAQHPVSTAESAPAEREPEPLRTPAVTTLSVTAPQAPTHRTVFIVLTTLRTVIVTSPQATTRQPVLVVSNTLKTPTVTAPPASTH